MKRDEASRSTSIKALKRRAREIRAAKDVPLGKALDLASVEAGFENYHEALRSLAGSAGDSDASGLKLADQAFQAIARFASEERGFDRMSRALAAIYNGKDQGFSEYALAVHAGLDAGVSGLLVQWLGTAFNSAQLDGARFETNVAMILHAGPYGKRPIACAVDGFVELAKRVERLLNVRGVKVGFSPLAMLLSRLEPGGFMSEWMHVVHDACPLAGHIADGTVVLDRGAKEVPFFGESEGAYYVLLGRASAPMSKQGELEHALMECAALNGLSCTGETSEGKVELSFEDFGTADSLVAWLYAAEMAEVSSFVQRVLEEEQVQTSQATLGLRVWERNPSRGNTAESGLERRVDAVVYLPDDVGRVGRYSSIELGSYLFPSYLHLAVQTAFGLTRYDVAK